LQGWSFGALNAWFGETEQRQFGMGYGALLCGTAFLFMLTWGLSASGRIVQDPFVAGALGLIIALVGLFVLLPVVQMLFAGLRSEDGSALAAFADRLVDAKLWRLGCLDGSGQCGVAWNSLALAVTVGFLSTLLGLAFALVIVRTSLPFKRFFKSLSLLPIITPPFVIGLAGTILVIGLAGYALLALGGVAITLFIALTLVGVFLCFCLAELASAFPDRAGGLPSYAFETFKPWGNTASEHIGGLSSWAYWLGWFTVAPINAYLAAGKVKASGNGTVSVTVNTQSAGITGGNPAANVIVVNTVTGTATAVTLPTLSLPSAVTVSTSGGRRIAMPAFIALADIRTSGTKRIPARKSSPTIRIPSTSALVSTS
jgi:hypothetical protein